MSCARKLGMRKTGMMSPLACISAGVHELDKIVSSGLVAEQSFSLHSDPRTTKTVLTPNELGQGQLPDCVYGVSNGTLGWMGKIERILFDER